MKNQQTTWKKTEEAILKEMAWLKNNIFPYQPNKNLLDLPDNIFYRAIAILIVSGKVKVFDYNYLNKKNNVSLLSLKYKKHGSNWHDGMINYLSKYFLGKKFNVFKNEPKLYYGHADLKIEKNNKTSYFEIDTVNIFKLFVNLKEMKSISIVLINNNKIIKFKL
ncbi:hypothetical protein ACFL1Y_00840 [Patescibacteria group bacterium]